MSLVLQSYNNFDGSSGPPEMPPSACPFCLAVWTGDPPKHLTKEQQKALHSALETWPAELSASEKQDLLEGLNQRHHDDVIQITNASLKKRCAAALKGETLPKFAVNASDLKKSREQDTKDHRSFVKELPRLIELQKKGKEAYIKPSFDMASEDITTLHEAQREIVNGNALAFEYFVRWAASVDNSAITDGGRCVDSVFGDILFDIARSKKLPWPKDVDMRQARSPFAASCLQYAYNPNQKPNEEFKKIISSPKHSVYAQIALKAAAGKKDRTVIAWIESINPAQVDWYGDAFTLYYQSVGNTDDLRYLEACATNAMNRFKKTNEGWRYDAPLDAYRVVRLKCQLTGAPASRTPAK